MVEIDNINFGYGKEDIIKNFSLNIDEGDFILIKGPNGAGKSTFLKLLLGFLTPRSGEIREANNYSISYVSQKVGSFNSDFPATVSEIVQTAFYEKFSFKRMFRRNRKLKQKAIIALRYVGMEEFADSQIGRLSGGQQQRVFISRAIAEGSSIMILDEPTVGVDEKSSYEICKFLSHLNKHHGKTIVIVTHDPKSVEPYVNKTVEFVKQGEYKITSQNNEERGEE